MIVLTRISLINLKNNRMDKLEYIPGDLAFHYIPKTIIKKYVKVYVCSTQNALSLEDMDGNLYDYIGELYPIPLTPEILEKNGWREEKGDYINDNYHIKLCEKIDGYSAYKVVNDTIVWLRDVKSVSNLQHLLFGLGLNSEMEV